MAFTEPVWLVASPPGEMHDGWSWEYPWISDRAGVEARIAAASYRRSRRSLPASAWWAECYGPMQDRIAALSRLPDARIAQEIVAAAEIEIGSFRRSSDCYSEEFSIAQPMV